MDISFQSNLDQFSDQLAAFIRFRGVGLPKALRYQGRLLAQLLIRLTPPRTRAQGRKAVSRDIKRLFIGLSDIQQAEFQSLGGDQVVRLFAKKDGTIYGVERALFRPDATIEELHDYHQKHRDKRGRVTRAGSFTRDIGRWKFLDRMAVPETVLNEYIAYVQSHVGQGKGGWATSLIGLGGNPAQWISVHARTAGRFDDRADDPVSGYIRMVNNSEWASSGDDDRIVENALRTRAGAIAEYLRHAQEEALQKSFAK